MSGSVNKVILVGNLGADPEVRRTQDGWHRVVIFNEGLAKVSEQYLKKGSRVYVEGQLQTRKWTDQQGQDRYSTEVVLQRFNSQLVMLVRGKSTSGTASTDSRTAAHNSWAEPSQPNPTARDEFNDEIPF